MQPVVCTQLCKWQYARSFRHLIDGDQSPSLQNRRVSTNDRDHSQTKCAWQNILSSHLYDAWPFGMRSSEKCAEIKVVRKDDIPFSPSPLHDRQIIGAEITDV